MFSSPFEVSATLKPRPGTYLPNPWPTDGFVPSENSALQPSRTQMLFWSKPQDAPSSQATVPVDRTSVTPPVVSAAQVCRSPGFEPQTTATAGFTGWAETGKVIPIATITKLARSTSGVIEIIRRSPCVKRTEDSGAMGRPGEMVLIVPSRSVPAPRRVVDSVTAPDSTRRS